MAAAASTGMLNAMPTPTSMTRQVASQAEEAAPSCERATMPPAKNSAPMVDGTRGPMRSASRPTKGEMSRDTAGMGVMAMAARSSL